MISKELLNEVLEDEVMHIYDKSDMGENYICYMPKLGCNVDINIYEFAFLCKEWALTKGYKIQSQLNSENKGHTHISKISENEWAKGFFENTELGAIFKACEWLLDNKED